ncbi:hypothetical protein KXW37_001399, partial [Aspergillus fumigatus]
FVMLASGDRTALLKKLLGGIFCLDEATANPRHKYIASYDGTWEQFPSFALPPVTSAVN